MVTTRGPAPAEPFELASDRHRAAYAQYRRQGMNHVAAQLACEHPDYLRYVRFVSPYDYMGALTSKRGINAYLTAMDPSLRGRLPQEDAPKEDIRPKAPGW